MVNCKLVLQLKDDINNFNDKRHMINNLIS